MRVLIEMDNEDSGTRDWTIKVTKVYRPPRSKKILTEITRFGASFMYGMDQVIKRIPDTMKRRRAIVKNGDDDVECPKVG